MMELELGIAFDLQMPLSFAGFLFCKDLLKNKK
jgi:hypothetical protein